MEYLDSENSKYDKELSFQDVTQFINSIEVLLIEFGEKFQENGTFSHERFLHDLFVEHNWSKFFKKSLKNGWYWVSDEIIGYDIDECISELNKGGDNFDRFMTVKINSHIQEIEQNILIGNEIRTPIVSEAFKLLSERRYLACIPLLLSQADGIVKDTINIQLFDKARDRKEFIKNRMIEHPEEVMILAQMDGRLTSCFIESLSGARARARARNKGPNRHAILHGDISYLDYGNELNALKCVALLSYVRVC